MEIPHRSKHAGRDRALRLGSIENKIDFWNRKLDEIEARIRSLEEGRNIKPARAENKIAYAKINRLDIQAHIYALQEERKKIISESEQR